MVKTSFELIRLINTKIFNTDIHGDVFMRGDACRLLARLHKADEMQKIIDDEKSQKLMLQKKLKESLILNKQIKQLLDKSLSKVFEAENLLS